MSNAIGQLIISLAPNALSAAITRRGKVQRAERIELNPSEWDDTWEGNLMRLDQPLRQLISRFPSRKCGSATLVYHSPTLTQQVMKSDLSHASAHETAIAKIRDAVGYSDPIETCTFTRSSKKNAESVTILAYSEREEQLRSLYAWMNRCNVKVAGLVPSSVAVMNIVSQIAKDVDPDTAVFYLGADVTVMAYATETGFKLIRSAEIGFQILAEGYSKALSAHHSALSESDGSSGGSPAKSSEDWTIRANEMLFEHGIPMGLVEADGIDLRSEVLPVIAPVLQRFGIEIKQTFRFGLDGAEMPKNMMFCGPGAKIPLITKALAQHVDMHIQLDPAIEGFEPLSAFGRGTLEHAVVSSGTCPAGLLPEIAYETATSRVLTRSLVAGGMLAALAMGGEYAYSTIELGKILANIKADEPRLEAVTAFREDLELANTMSSVISDVSQLVCDTVVCVPQWQGVLSTLPDLMGDSIRLQELNGEFTPEAPVLRVDGYAVADTEKETGQALNAFIAQLEASDRVAQVSLGATSRISVGDDQWGRKFTMKITLEQRSLMHTTLVHTESQWDDGVMP